MTPARVRKALAPSGMFLSLSPSPPIAAGRSHIALGCSRAHASSFETTASSGLLRMRLSSTVLLETAAKHSVLILRSPPQAGV